MTTYFPFTPSNRVAPQFFPTFDGQNYTIIVMWNISAQRYYLNCTDIQNNLVFMLPIIESNPALQIASMEYDDVNHWVILETFLPHNVETADLIKINIINCIPKTYNGYVNATILDDTHIQYMISPNPGVATTMGQVDLSINIIKGYFDSTLVFRNKMFEVNP
jgi:hypothetical protein